jgi:hypothetical protein
LSETRTGKRFPLQLPITIRDGSHESKEQSGVTQNVSAAGVYISADANVEVGSEIEFDITLPADIVGSQHDVQVRCHGRVVRSEITPDAPQAGLACIIDNYWFVRNSKEDA